MVTASLMTMTMTMTMMMMMMITFYSRHVNQTNQHIHIKYKRDMKYQLNCQVQNRVGRNTYTLINPSHMLKTSLPWSPLTPHPPNTCLHSPHKREKEIFFIYLINIDIMIYLSFQNQVHKRFCFCCDQEPELFCVYQFICSHLLMTTSSSILKSCKSRETGL